MNKSAIKSRIAKIGGYVCAIVVVVWVVSGPASKLVDSANNLSVAIGAVLYIISFVAVSLIMVDAVSAAKRLFRRKK
jgi:hypothetical protein